MTPDAETLRYQRPSIQARVVGALQGGPARRKGGLFVLAECEAGRRLRFADTS